MTITSFVFLKATLLEFTAKAEELNGLLRDFQGEHVENMEAILEALGMEDRPHVTVRDVVNEIKKLKGTN